MTSCPAQHGCGASWCYPCGIEWQRNGCKHEIAYNAALRPVPDLDALLRRLILNEREYMPPHMRGPRVFVVPFIPGHRPEVPVNQPVANGGPPSQCTHVWLRREGTVGCYNCGNTASQYIEECCVCPVGRCIRCTEVGPGADTAPARPALAPATGNSVR